ncbi:MAG: hypothetical protein HGB03_02645 [Candidatus Yonathbacteria bacterium]|nr:hypothetical protein [Candidatus Yonathbacteria bacterium]NTW47460.1 hypothetical protein [Candidatus Yonathbacteria bacterium]
MFEIFFKNKKIIFGVLAVILAFVAYQMLFVSGKSTDEGTSVLIEDQGDLSAEDQTTLQMLSDMQTIKLNATVLQNPAFISLQDFSIPLQNEPQGRRNPFAPIGTTNDISTADTSDKTVVKTGLTQ